jgi:hypothetical protein
MSDESKEMVKAVKYYATKLMQAAEVRDTLEMSDLLDDLKELQQQMICMEICAVYDTKDERQLDLIPDDPELH